MSQQAALVRRRAILVSIRGLGCLLLVALLATSVGAQSSRNRARAPAAAEGPLDAQDAILLCPHQPLLIRFRVAVDEMPFRYVWQRFFKQLFRDLDRNKDGKLDAAEASRLPWPTGGKAFTEEEYWDLCRQQAPPFAIRLGQRQAGNRTVLFELLDTDHDGKLSAVELSQAPAILERRDFDSDGTVSLDELVYVEDLSAGKAANDVPVLLVENGTLAPAELDRLVRTYDTNGDGRLSGPQHAPEEIGLAPAVFAALDRNHDGYLDRQELESIGRRAPDLELRFSLGRGIGPRSGLRGRPLEEAPAGAVAVEPFSDGSYKLEVGSVEVEIRRNNRDAGGRSRFSTRFRELDADKNGYLDAKEVKDDPELAAAFNAMDLDGDGKVFQKEFDAYVLRMSKLASIRLVLEGADNGHEIFGFLDKNQDGHLSLRELRSAPDVLKILDKDHDGALSAWEIPHRLELEISRGGSDGTVGPRLIYARDSRIRSSGAANAPLWFQKMDANHDGDLTPEEFLGSRAEFDRLDRNHDGLIDAAEAALAGKGKSNGS